MLTCHMAPPVELECQNCVKKYNTGEKEQTRTLSAQSLLQENVQTRIGSEFNRVCYPAVCEDTNTNVDDCGEVNYVMKENC